MSTSISVVTSIWMVNESAGESASASVKVTVVTVVVVVVVVVIDTDTNLQNRPKQEKISYVH